MDFTLLHPAEQIVMIMERIYGYGMTTTSGGNLSILDEEGNIWQARRVVRYSARVLLGVRNHYLWA